MSPSIPGKQFPERPDGILTAITPLYDKNPLIAAPRIGSEECSKVSLPRLRDGPLESGLIPSPCDVYAGAIGATHCRTHRLYGPHDFRVDCELCRHWGLSRRTGAKQNCAGGVEERRGRSRFFAGAKQNGAGAKQNGGGEEEGVSWGWF
ncbi:hypothetical protein Bbelb_260270 [Branchiostoma belcheri]|nr:hypothetical protein Bbelb_260270 [Branchiostoma belcheri]